MGLDIKLRNVTHHYGLSPDEGTGVVALRDVTLDFASGSFVAIMGASGSGKSTLLHMIGAIDRPTSGEIHLGEREIARLSERELTLIRRQAIGFVFQFFNLIPTLTVRENVRFPLDMSGSAGNREAIVREILGRVGLSHRADHFPTELSGGEMQRVAIARAVVHRPPLVIADEPTGNLDSRTGESILELLRDLHRESGMTLLMATHSLRAASFALEMRTIADGVVGASEVQG